MIRSPKMTKLAALGAATALVLAACGESGTDDGDAAEDEETGSQVTSESDGVFTVGSLLPATGDLAFLGPPEFAGVELAIEDINAAGGVLGQEVVYHEADSGDGTPDIASAEVDKLLDNNVDMIVGAAASGVSITVVDKITSNGVIQFSPANTAAGFDTPEVDPHGLYFRTAPTDRLQGEVLANLIVEDGNENVVIMARQDFYGEGLAERTKEILEEKGATVPELILYQADAQNFTAEVNQLAAAQPDAVVLIAFSETEKIIPELAAKGIGPQDVQLYFTDGNLSNYEDVDFDLTGTKGTAPSPAEPDADFSERLQEQAGEGESLLYGPESYDAVIITALAAIAADTDAATEVAEHIVDVTRDGEKCTTFADCKELLEAGEDIDYDGKSGPTDMTSTGSVERGTYGINQYDGNEYSSIDSVTGIVQE